MKKCDCYYTEEKIIGWHTPVDPKTTIVHKCNGTREQDECSCCGDRTKCDFYPEVREKALKEQEPKFGKWISVEDRLPDMDCLPANFIVAAKVGSETVIDLAERYPYRYVRTGETGADWEIFHDWDEGQGCEITHWMPLPTPPTEKE
jgi:hypothetical protein